jgi:hypothetical protein
MNVFDQRDVGDHPLKLCPKVVKHPVYRCCYCGRCVCEGRSHGTDAVLSGLSESTLCPYANSDLAGFRQNPSYCSHP